MERRRYGWDEAGLSGVPTVPRQKEGEPAEGVSRAFPVASHPLGELQWTFNGPLHRSTVDRRIREACGQMGLSSGTLSSLFRYVNMLVGTFEPTGHLEVLSGARSYK